jgi:hypothetical protein
MALLRTAQIVHVPGTPGTNELMRDIIDDLLPVRAALPVSYTIGDLLYASSATALAKLADAADGSVLRSGGVGAAPLWGKVRLSGATTDITGTLGTANGGTGGTLPVANGGTGTAAVNACRVFHSVDQNVSSGSATELLFNSEVFDTAGMHSTSLNTSRITIVTAGTYVVIGHFQIRATTPGASEWAATIRLNGNANVARQAITYDAVAGDRTIELNVSTILDLAAGEYLELVAL